MFQCFKGFEDEGQLAVGLTAAVAAQGQEFHHQIAVIDRSLQQFIGLYDKDFGRAATHCDGCAVVLIADKGHFSYEFTWTDSRDLLRCSAFFAAFNDEFS